jgi:integrase/recombinase XerD
VIEQLFPRDWGRFAMSPNGDLVCEFADWIEQRGYSRICSRVYVRHLRRVVMFSEVKRDSKGCICLSAIDVLFSPWADDPFYRATRRAVVQCLAARSILISDIARAPLDEVIDEYQVFLTDVCGFSPSTISHHTQTVQRLTDQECPDPAALSDLLQEDVDRFVEHVGKSISRHSLQHTISHLRSFLQFCADSDYTKKKLGVIDMPRVYRGELPVRALDWTVVCKLLQSIDQSTIEGIRDYAILYLMAHYGLRPSEVAGLTIDAIDWQTATLQVKQCKTRSKIILPLDDQGQRVIHHYLESRPTDAPWKEIFLKVRYPADPIKGATIGDIYDKRVRLSGLPIIWSSPYSLRHSFAMRLLQGGVAIKTIGDFLGHRSLESTCVYLRLHVEALREVGLPVPRANPTLATEAL